MAEELQLRTHGGGKSPTVVYLPGLHGDWTLVGGFREALRGGVRWIEVTYPRRTDWSLADYARAVDVGLREVGVERGWLLGESFGSQVLWAMVADGERQYAVDGLILAGGFVRHPTPGLVGLARRAFAAAPLGSMVGLLRAYAAVSRWRRRHSPARLAEMDEFLSRRNEADRAAAAHRLRLIAEADWRPIAARTELPVYYLTGGWDPIVPWGPVRSWLRHSCPGFRAWRRLGASDHNVLGNASEAAAAQVLEWIAATDSPAKNDSRPQ
ncbi:MAG: alpha/beta fold hydrolase [Limisphaerales bacterium]